MLTQQRLRDVLSYDEATGQFIWRVHIATHIKAGRVAGAVHKKGYCVIRVDGRLYLSHRLAWLYVHGEWPHPMIDHIDGDKRNNRIANLRIATAQLNQQNMRRARCDSGSGLLGAYPRRGKWTARLRVDGRYQTVGTFDTPELAHAAYVTAKRQLHAGNTL